jgi:hypothetical protein
VTGLDWLILVFVLAMGFWGYQQGLLVGALSLAGFAIGAFAGSRLGPALLPDGSESAYAPALALAGAFLIGGIAAVSLEGLARALRARSFTAIGWWSSMRRGALLLAALGLGLAWLFGAVALNTPGRGSSPRGPAIGDSPRPQRPSRHLGPAQHPQPDRPRVAINGPSPGVGPPDSRIAGTPM